MNRVQNEPCVQTSASQRPRDELRISVVDAIAEVSAADWDACANPTANSPSDPSTVTASVQLNDRASDCSRIRSGNGL